MTHYGDSSNKFWVFARKCNLKSFSNYKSIERIYIFRLIESNIKEHIFLLNILKKLKHCLIFLCVPPCFWGNSHSFDIRNCSQPVASVLKKWALSNHRFGEEHSSESSAATPSPSNRPFRGTILAGPTWRGWQFS